MKPSEEIAAIKQNAQAKIQLWNAVRKMIPASRTIANDTGQRNDLSKEYIWVDKNKATQEITYKQNITKQELLTINDYKFNLRVK